MWQWVVANKAFLFDGTVGAAILAILGFLFNRAFRTPAAPPVNISVTQTNQQTAEADRTPAVSPPATEPPGLFSIPPRIVSIENEAHDDVGFVGGGDGTSLVAVATYQRTPDDLRRSLCLTARIRYWAIPEDPGLRPPEFALVKNGAWMEESFNCAIMGLADTEQIILAIQARGDLGVVQDNRFSVSNNRGFFIMEVPTEAHQIYACLSIVDEKFGQLAYDCFHIRRSPFAIEREFGMPKWKD